MGLDKCELLGAVGWMPSTLAVDRSETQDPKTGRLSPHQRIPRPSSFAALEAERASCGCGRCPQPGNQRQDGGEHPPRYGDLSHLEGHVASVAHHLRANLDQFLTQARQ